MIKDIVKKEVKPGDFCLLSRKTYSSLDPVIYMGKDGKNYDYVRDLTGRKSRLDGNQHLYQSKGIPVYRNLCKISFQDLVESGINIKKLKKLKRDLNLKSLKLSNT